ncbi:hypothetical protein LQW54_011788 [Pestalotiopsis sp. IQ-011]
MDAQLKKLSEVSPWARSIDLARQKDGRVQPWKPALEVEAKAKEDGTYDQILDVSHTYPDIGDGGKDGSLRACNF